ncbi:hypothetical protein B0H10DRAFT_1208872 [Mycena sp. CBHHK59/15]|nr:hypothetical protein B0H10DRAFT_1208872 [Mycena sp. CBHHK59/15]
MSSSMSPTLSASPAYPPTAHTSPKALITEQPTPSSVMSIVRENPEEKNFDNAARIRGGCIPCPGGFFLPTLCTWSTETECSQTEAVATLSPFLAAFRATSTILHEPDNDGLRPQRAGDYP